MTLLRCIEALDSLASYKLYLGLTLRDVCSFETTEDNIRYNHDMFMSMARDGNNGMRIKGLHKKVPRITNEENRIGGASTRLAPSLRNLFTTSEVSMYIQIFTKCRGYKPLVVQVYARECVYH